MGFQMVSLSTLSSSIHHLNGFTDYVRKNAFGCNLIEIDDMY